MTPSQHYQSGIWAKILAAALLAFSLLAGISIVAFAPSVRTILLIAIGAALVLPLIRRVASHTFDILEPLVLLNISCFVMFFVRPIALLATGSLSLRGVHSIADTFDETLGIALLGVVGLQVGYHLTLGRRGGSRMPPMHDDLYPSTSLVLVLIMLLTALAAYIREYSGGRDIVSNSSSAYIYLAPYMVAPASMILSHLGRTYRARWLSLAGYLTLGLFALSVLPTGRRLMLMQVVLGVFILFLLRSGYRPSTGALVGLGLVAFYLIVSMRDLQPGGGIEELLESLRAHIADTSGSIETLTTSNDTEMFDGLAAELAVIPESLPYQPGSALYLLVTHPIPRAMWEGKPRAIEDQLNFELFGTEMGMAGVAFSILGGFYADSGPLGVLLGMVILGLGFRVLWEYLLANMGNESVRMLYASFLPFVISILRGNLQYLLAIALFVSVPIVIITWISGHSGKQKHDQSQLAASRGFSR